MHTHTCGACLLPSPPTRLLIVVNCYLVRPQPAFNGRDALVEALAARKAAAERGVFEGTRVLTLVLEDPCVDVLPLGNEVISIDGVGVGRVTSAAFSYTLGVPVCMGCDSACTVWLGG